VHPLPAEIDREIASMKLETLGISIDSLTAEQADIRARWK
jgi:adenosylhomocysteinase